MQVIYEMSRIGNSYVRIPKIFITGHFFTFGKQIKRKSMRWEIKPQAVGLKRARCVCPEIRKNFSHDILIKTSEIL